MCGRGRWRDEAKQNQNENTPTQDRI